MEMEQRDEKENGEVQEVLDLLCIILLHHYGRVFLAAQADQEDIWNWKEVRDRR